MEILSSIFDEYDDHYYTPSSSQSDDSIYAEELQLQEALAASLYISTTNKASSSSSRNHASTSSSSSSSLPVSCEICTEDKRKSDMYKVEGCHHSFCSVCISKHIEYKLQQNIVHISCPDQDCRNTMEPDNGSSLRSIIPRDILDRWEKAITESTITEEIIHCPYDKCSEILVIENGDDGVAITETECPRCHRLFCAKCRVSWHYGFDCRDFRRFDRNDKEKRKLRLLAKENNWKKCPNCRVFVDKTEGCIHITCRCKFEFCYKCGKSWSESHWKTCKE